MAEDKAVGQQRSVRPRPNACEGPSSTYEGQPGPELSLDSVYRDHADFVWRCLKRFGVADSELEDRMHDVFMVVQRRLPEFDGRAAMTSWLYGIARGVAANDRRSRRRARLHLEQIGASERLRVELDQRSPDDEMLHRRALDMIADFLPGLETHLREAFVLVDLEGLKPRDAALALKLTPEEIHSRLRTARRRFAGFIRGQRGTDA